MDGFFTYFLGGMLGEELMRKIATRPFGFMILWLIGFFLINLFYIILVSSFIVLGIFSDPAAEPSVLRYIFDCFALVAVGVQPGATFIALGGGLLFAIGYRGHYRNNLREKERKMQN